MSAGTARRVQVTLGLQTDKAPGAYAQLARLAEDLGFDGVSVFSDLLYQPPVAALLEMAAATTRVRLGCACWNPYTLHPYEIAGQFAAVDAASGGRAYLVRVQGVRVPARAAEPQPSGRRTAISSSAATGGWYSRSENTLTPSKPSSSASTASRAYSPGALSVCSPSDTGMRVTSAHPWESNGCRCAPRA